MNEKYKEIINMPHHVSTNRPPIPRTDRAAQFAPYSALSGYEDAVEETARIVNQPIELDESEKEKINDILTSLLSAEEARVRLTFFRPDERKSGGAYVTVTGEVGRIDEISREITLVGGSPIGIDRIIEIYEI